MINKRTGIKLPLSDPVDILLADVAIRIQLSPTDYNKAVSRYRTISDWIERAGSPLEDHVQLCYAQGSMATGSTIASKFRTDEFDIDVAAQLALPDSLAPREILDALYEAIRGEPGSRYHDMVKRRTRCVTVDYSDDMHLDVTPMLRRIGTPDRESWICHHDKDAPLDPGKRLVANPYGFAEWFKSNTPPDHEFAEAYQMRTRDYAQMVITAKAESEPVPPQDLAVRKSKAVIVLQLLKRWRNLCYGGRSARRPPSIMISKLVADAANHTDGLAEELLHQARYMLTEFERWQAAGQRIHVVNPVCSTDALTDRWPESVDAQAVFIGDLHILVENVERLVSGCPLDEMKRIMVALFGETPTTDVFIDYVRRQGNAIANAHSQHIPGSGRLIAPASIAVGFVAVPSEARQTPRHTFYGHDRRS